MLPVKVALNSKDIMTNGIRKVKTSDLDLKDRLVSIQRVTKVTKGGRTFSFSAIVVVGDEKGIAGHGLGKAKEVTTAIAKGVEDAKKNLVKVPVLHGTIPHEHSQFWFYKRQKVQVFLLYISCFILSVKLCEPTVNFYHNRTCE